MEIEFITILAVHYIRMSKIELKLRLYITPRNLKAISNPSKINGGVQRSNPLLISLKLE